jgi:hypothetical protein
MQSQPPEVLMLAFSHPDRSGFCDHASPHKIGVQQQLSDRNASH